MTKITGTDHIIIIGAGAAGLMAARELAQACKVTVLEARALPGGRIRTISGSGIPIEEGAEFVHGKLPLTLRLLEEAGLEYSRVEGDMYQVTNGNWKKPAGMMEGWEELLGKMRKESGDTLLSAFLEQHYGKETDTLFREGIIKYAQGYDLADITQVSVRALYDEWVNEAPDNFRIHNGYGSLIDFLVEECRKAGCDIRTGSRVKKIVWNEGRVTVLTDDNSSFTGCKVIVTVSLGILQQERTAGSAILFSPAIPDYMYAAKMMGYGSVIKMNLQFDQAFWNEYKKNIGFILSDQQVVTWWTQGPDHTPWLTGWLGGPPADDWIHAQEDELLELGLHSLAGIFKIDLSTLKAMFIKGRAINWRADEWALGGYSYPTPFSAAARRLLNEPIENTVYFAGEALYDGSSPGTVEAALESGRKVAAGIQAVTA